MVRTLAVLVVVSALAASASAEPRHHGGWQGGHSYQHDDHDDIVGSFWGGILGGWLAGQQASRPGRDSEDVEGDLEPWSKAWFGYCTSKYRSFDPTTGRYLGYDGEFHFCH